MSRPVLAPLSAAYGAAVAARAALYRSGWLSVRRAPVPVISIGNIVAGGTGKTPVVALVARMLVAEGLRPAVVSRGYRGRRPTDPLVVSAGRNEPPRAVAAEAGDEPLMLAWSLPEVPVIVARSRAAGARMAAEKLDADCVVLDDGFQHLGLARDLDLVMLDGQKPLDNGKLLPSGLLRESPGGLRRAGAFLVSLTAGTPPPEPAEFAEKISPWARRGTPVFHIMFEATELLGPDGRAARSLEWLRGKDLVAFAGIARPERFERTLTTCGAWVRRFIPFPDHHDFSARDVDLILDNVAACAPQGLITTEKDLARLSRTGAGRQLAAAGLIGLRGAARLDGDHEAFAGLIRAAARGNRRQGAGTN